MSHFIDSQILLEVIFSGKLHFPGNNISREVKITGKSQLPGSQMSREVTSLLVSLIWRLDGGGGEEGGEKRLVDLRRSSLMASPQVKIIFLWVNPLPLMWMVLYRAGSEELTTHNARMEYSRMSIPCCVHKLSQQLCESVHATSAWFK